MYINICLRVCICSVNINGRNVKVLCAHYVRQCKLVICIHKSSFIKGFTHATVRHIVMAISQGVQCMM